MTNTFIPEHGKRTTLRDVAREAGVSIKTVSRVVNDEPLVTGFIVLAFFFVLRYFPELAGRSLEDIETSLREGTFRPGGVPIRDEGEEGATT